MTASFNLDQLRLPHDLGEFATMFDGKNRIRRAVDNEKRCLKAGELTLPLISAGEQEMVGCTFETPRPVTVSYDEFSRAFLIERMARTRNRPDISNHELDNLRAIRPIETGGAGGMLCVGGSHSG